MRNEHTIKSESLYAIHRNKQKYNSGLELNNKHP